MPGQQTSDSPEVSVVMPCLNEAETLAVCIQKARACLADNGVSGEIIIADNGSTDGSQSIAEAGGARVVPVEAKGYGSALMGGIAAARGRFVIMGDADDSYDFSALMPFIEELRDGCDLVMGNRFKGGIAPGAMPPLHRYFGNPVLSGLGRLFFPLPGRGLSLWSARVQSCGVRPDEIADDRHGVCRRDGRQVDAAWSANCRGANDALTGWSQPAATLAKLA